MANEKKIYIYSTLTSDMEYRRYVAGGGDMQSVGASVLIRGGTNLPNKHLLTPLGAVTAISEAAFSWLQEDEIFKLHVANGFITFSEKEVAPEKAAADMETRDQSAPLVDADFKEDEKPVETKAKGNGRRA